MNYYVGNSSIYKDLTIGFRSISSSSLSTGHIIVAVSDRWNKMYAYWRKKLKILWTLYCLLLVMSLTKWVRQECYIQNSPEARSAELCDKFADQTCARYTYKQSTLDTASNIQLEQDLCGVMHEKVRMRHSEIWERKTIIVCVVVYLGFVLLKYSRRGLLF